MSDDENKKLTITQQVKAINAQLRAFGREAVQEIKMMKDGQNLHWDHPLERLNVDGKGCYL